MPVKSSTGSEIYSCESPMRLSDDSCAGSDTPTSAKAYITSATAPAATTNELSSWAHKAKFDTVIETTIPDATIFEPIRNLQTASTTFPNWLKSPDSPEYRFIAPNHCRWKDDLCSTLQRFSRFSFGRNWEADLPYAVVTIFQICHHHKIVRQLDRNELGSKMDMRFCIDTLIAYICEVDNDGLAHYFAKPTLRLPNCTTDKATVATTTVDGVIALPIIDFGPYLTNSDLQEAASAFVGTPETRDLALVHCVAVFKSTGSGENEMKMAMVSALHQKKVLHIQNQFVFGIFQCGRDFIQVNVGYWINDKIKIYRVERFALQSAASLVQFYLVLREIKRLASGYKQQLIRFASTLQRAIYDNPPVSGWVPMHPSDTNESTGELHDLEASGGELMIRPGLSPILDSLGQWDVGDRINTFRHSTGPCGSESSDGPIIS